MNQTHNQDIVKQGNGMLKIVHDEESIKQNSYCERKKNEIIDIFLW